MAFDTELAERIREALVDRPAVVEKKMFGGLAFLSNGHMFAGVIKDELMVRVGPEQYADALAQPHARELGMNGRPMTGMVLVGTAGIAESGALDTWVGRGLRFVLGLPSKK